MTQLEDGHEVEMPKALKRTLAIMAGITVLLGGITALVGGVTQLFNSVGVLFPIDKVRRAPKPVDVGSGNVKVQMPRSDSDPSKINSASDAESIDASAGKNTREPALQKSKSDESIDNILSGCYRRAIFTRAHAQLSWDAMFTSLQKCSEIIAVNSPNVRPSNISDRIVGLRSSIDEILAYHRAGESLDKDRINELKLEALHNFRVIAKVYGKSFSLPAEGKLGESTYFTQEEADAPLAPTDLHN